MIMYLTGMLKRSSLSQARQAEVEEELINMYQSEADDLIILLEMNQLDLTQLGNYTKTDITKRLDYIDKKEKM